MQQHPKEAAFVLWCTARNPELRPTAREILDLDLFDTSEEIFMQFNQRLAEKDCEILRLKDELNSLKLLLEPKA